MAEVEKKSTEYGLNLQDCNKFLNSKALDVKAIGQPNVDEWRNRTSNNKLLRSISEEKSNKLYEYILDNNAEQNPFINDPYITQKSNYVRDM